MQFEGLSSIFLYSRPSFFKLEYDIDLKLCVLIDSLESYTEEMFHFTNSFLLRILICTSCPRSSGTIVKLIKQK